MHATLTAVKALWQREIVKFVRDRSRLLGALFQPIIFWLLLGFGFQHTFQLPNAAHREIGYLEYLFPGIITLILLFTAIFSTISVVTERRDGFLQSVLVAPVPRTALVMGIVLGSTTLAVGEVGLFLLAAPLVGLPVSVPGLLIALGTSALIAIAFTALGFAIAWNRDSVRGFHSVMNLFLIPLWALSGAFFPATNAHPVLQWIMTANPVTYGVTALRYGVHWPNIPPDAPISLSGSVLVMAGFAVAMIAITVYLVRQPLYPTGSVPPDK